MLRIFEHDNPEDMKQIAQLFHSNHNVRFNFSPSNGICFVVILMSRFEQIARMNGFGDDTGRVWVGICGIGLGHFDLEKQNHSSYIEEKLSLRDKSEAKGFLALFNAIMESRRGD